MGYYIEGPARGKIDYIVKEYGAKSLDRPPNSIDEIDDDLALICVVQNFSFDAAGYVYSDNELVDFNDPSDMRMKMWLTMDKKKVEKLTGFND